MRKTLSTLFTLGLVTFAQPAVAQNSCCGTAVGCMGSGYDYAVNVPVSFADLCECNWVAHVDYLYWKPYEDCLEFTTKGTTEVSGAPVNYNLSATNKLVNFDWDSGFRIGIGYGFPCDKWTLAADWTHYRTDTKTNQSSSSLLNVTDPTLVTFSAPFINTPIEFFDVGNTQQASFLGKWSLQFNQVDISLSRSFYVGPCVSIRPHISVSFLDLKQDMNVCEEFVILNENTAQANNFARLVGKYKCEYKGVGMKAGLDSNWELCGGFGFFGEWNVAAYYGTFDTNHKTLINAFGDVDVGDNGTTNIKVSQDFDALRISNHLAIGLSWLSKFNCDRNMFVFKAGWEHNVFFSQNMFPVLDIIDGGDGLPVINHIECRSADIYLYGFMFSFAITF